MTRRNAKLAGMIAGVLVIAAGLKLAGVAPVFIVCFLGAGFLIFLAVKLRQRRKTEVIFRFYVSADELLRGEERRRYNFEITETIKAGEKVVRSMSDPPPLSCFALGALYSSIGDHNGAVEHLGLAAEEELLKESLLISPSRKLRRYVERLRQIERSPKRSARINAAIASLERMHREQGARLLAESQRQLKRMIEAYEAEAPKRDLPPRRDLPIHSSRSLKSITPPPPISEVLNEIYQEEPNA
jgi:hypothetical protein